MHDEMSSPWFAKYLRNHCGLNLSKERALELARWFLYWDERSPGDIPPREMLPYVKDELVPECNEGCCWHHRYFLIGRKGMKVYLDLALNQCEQRRAP